MSARPWMPFYVNDFRIKTLDLTASEIGVYMVLLILAWQREDAAIPNDMAWLKRSLKSCVSDLHGHTFNAVVPKLLERYFVLGADDKWRNKRVSKERQKALKFNPNAPQTNSYSNEINNLQTTQPQSQPHSQRVEGFNQIGLKAKSEGPKHGSISKDRRFIYIEIGTPDWDSYAADYRTVKGGSPKPNDKGGRWFSLLGETAKEATGRRRRWESTETKST